MSETIASRTGSAESLFNRCCVIVLVHPQRSSFLLKLDTLRPSPLLLGFADVQQLAEKSLSSVRIGRPRQSRARSRGQGRPERDPADGGNSRSPGSSREVLDSGPYSFRQENWIAGSAAAGRSPSDLAGSRRLRGITARTTRRI